jgi:anti-sigma regulatory factor (Ser/Thr protein kinase)
MALPVVQIDLPGAFSLKQGRLERMIRLLQPVFSLSEPAHVVIDLSRLVSISPSALALLTAAVDGVTERWVADQETNVTIVPPISPSTRTYVQRMNLLRSVSGFGHIEEPFKRHQEEGFRGCLRFVDDDDYWLAAKELSSALAERCVMDQLGRAAIRVCLDEVTENVIHHAQASAGFAAAQGWRKNSEFEIAIVDLGIGIRASLTANEKYAHITADADAIETALLPQVTATPERNAGIGLFVTRQLLTANGGELICSVGVWGGVRWCYGAR